MMSTIDKSKQSRKYSLALFAGIGCVLSIIVGIVAVHIFRTYDTTNALRRYSFLGPAAVLQDKQDALVNFHPLRESLKNTYTNHDDYLVSIYFEYLPTGAHISVNRDARIWPASLIKIPVAMAAMKKVERGDWKLSNELVILDEDKDRDFGELYRKPTGTTIAIEQLLEESLARSDNTAHFVLLRNIESSELEEVFIHLGLDETLEALKRAPTELEVDNRMTARGFSIFFRSLYNATYLSPEYSQMFLSILLNSPREYLALGLPEEVPFAHKTGIRADDQVWVDSGIVYLARRPYLLTVMIQKNPNALVPTSSPEELFSVISKEVHDYVANLR